MIDKDKLLISFVTVLLFAHVASADIAVLGTRERGGSNEPAPIRAKRLTGKGGWRDKTHGPRVNQRWDLDVRRNDDNTLSGQVTLVGSPLARNAALNGKIEGRQVTGTLADERGKLIASFRGTVTDTGISGQYTDRTGESGDWAWEGSLPQ